MIHKDGSSHQSFHGALFRFKVQSPTPMLTNKFVDPNFTLEIENGILFCRFNLGVIIDLALAQHLVAERVRFVQNTSYPVLVDFRALNSIEKDARDFFSSEDGQAFLKAGAFVISSPLSKTLANFYLKLTNPRLPARIFSDEESAIQWLHNYL